MYYVEQIRNGMLMCKTSPDGKWTVVTSTIELSDFEKILIKFCKGHYRDMFEERGRIYGLKLIYKEFYALDAEEHPLSFRECMFNKLLDIWLKVIEDNSGSNVWLKRLFYNSFNKSFPNNNDLPVERTILELCSQISNTKLITDDRIQRYTLDVENQKWK
jgi:hypothetical protein